MYKTHNLQQIKMIVTKQSKSLQYARYTSNQLGTRLYLINILKESAALVGEADKRCSILSSLETLVLNYINNFNTNKIHAIPKN